MRKTLKKHAVLILSMLFWMLITMCCSCSQKSSPSSAPSVWPDTSVADSTIAALRDEVQASRDSVKLLRMQVGESRIAHQQAADAYKSLLDSMYQAKITADYKLERVNYYISCCEKRTTNKKYFYGWIKRAMGR